MPVTMALTWVRFPTPKLARTPQKQKRYAMGSQCFDRRERIIYMVPPTNSPFSVSRKRTARAASAYFTAIPKNANTIIQKMAPGPPRHMAPATPTRFPVPTVAARAVHKARKGVTPFPPEGARSASRRTA